jgi:hypothetical protein
MIVPSIVFATQSAFPPYARARGSCPTWMVRVLLVRGSKRHTESSSGSLTHTDPPPTATPPGVNSMSKSCDDGVRLGIDLGDGRRALDHPDSFGADRDRLGRGDLDLRDDPFLLRIDAGDDELVAVARPNRPCRDGDRRRRDPAVSEGEGPLRGAGERVHAGQLSSGGVGDPDRSLADG